MATIFTAIGNGRGQELWLSYGTPSTTALLKDIRSGAAGSSAQLLGPLLVSGVSDPGRLLLLADDGVSGSELWVTDGTDAGTTLFKDINAGAAGSFASAWVALGTQAVFTAQDAASGNELWVSDGTPGGTTLLADLNAGAAGSAPLHLGSLVVAGKADAGQAMFVLSDGKTGREIWVTDGTKAGTTQLKDINPAGDSTPTPWTAVGGVAVFGANNGTAGQELWVSDGTGAGTALLLDAATGLPSSDPEVLGPLLVGGVADSTKLLVALDNITNGRELWLTDGTKAGTALFLDAAPGAAGSDPGAWTAVGKTAVFAATTAAEGRELWVSDGTAKGTTLLLDANPGAAGSDPVVLGPLLVAGVPDTTKLLVRLDDGKNGAELWVTDGTKGGTSLFLDINAGAKASDPTAWTAVNGRAVFVAQTDAAGAELWTSDGTALGTSLLLDANPGAAGSTPALVGPLMVNGVADPTRLVFLMDDGSAGQELWVTNGTKAGTTLFRDLNAGAGASFALPGFEAKTAHADFKNATGAVTYEIGTSSVADVTGSALADVLTGSAAANKIAGGAGDDFLIGGTGDDMLTGGPGVDILVGSWEGKDNDTAIYTGTRAEYDIVFDSKNGMYGVLTTGADGNDLVVAVNNLKFSDREITIRGPDGLPQYLVAAGLPQLGLSQLMIGGPYVGKVAGLTDEFVYPTTQNLQIFSSLKNAWILTGSGDDAVAVSSGRNVIDAGTGSNFLQGGTGQDTFFVDGTGATPTWDTINSFGATDEVTLWGVSDSTYTLTWATDVVIGVDVVKGLTLQADAAGKPSIRLTFPGFSNADLFSNGGRLVVFADNFEPESARSYTYITLLPPV